MAKIYPVQCDLTRESEILNMFKWIETTIGQGVSVTINNAGTMIKSKMLGAYISNIILCSMYCSSSTVRYQGFSFIVKGVGDRGSLIYPGVSFKRYSNIFNTFMILYKQICTYIYILFKKIKFYKNTF